MTFTVSAAQLGTPESAWLACAPLVAAPLLELPSRGRVVVIAPHPDDEVLAVGGTMRALAARGCSVEIVAVTDGEASHPRSRVVTRAMLATRRAEERAEALARLGVADAEVSALRCPDGAVARSALLAEQLAELVRGAACCLAPWERDGHPDHDATGLAALYACSAAEVPLLQYPVWAWHWAKPRNGDLPWERARRVTLSPETLEAKRAAIRAFRTQVEPLGDDAPILPRPVLARFERPFETFFA